MIQRQLGCSEGHGRPLGVAAVSALFGHTALAWIIPRETAQWRPKQMISWDCPQHYMHDVYANICHGCIPQSLRDLVADPNSGGQAQMSTLRGGKEDSAFNLSPDLVASLRAAFSELVRFTQLFLEEAKEKRRQVGLPYGMYKPKHVHCFFQFIQWRAEKSCSSRARAGGAPRLSWKQSQRL